MNKLFQHFDPSFVLKFIQEWLADPPEVKRGHYMHVITITMWTEARDPKHDNWDDWYKAIVHYETPRKVVKSDK